MKFKCIGTGSSGNGYLLECENSVLIIEAGKGMFKKILSNIPKDKKISALIYSHMHGDHYGDVRKFAEFTEIAYFNSKGRFENEDFIVKRFLVFHNVECFAFAIYCKSEQKSLLFATDFVKVIDQTIYDFKPDFAAVELSYNEMIKKEMSEDERHGLDYHSSDYHTIGFLRKFFKLNPNMTAVTIHKSERACNYGLTNKQLFENFGLRASIISDGREYKF